MVRDLPLRDTETGDTGRALTKAWGAINRLVFPTWLTPDTEEKKMRYTILANLGLILSILAVLGKSVWGKSTW